MKSKNLNGHVMSENEMKEVKGGCEISPKNVTDVPKECGVCGGQAFDYYSEPHLFICKNCGCTVSEEEGSSK